MAKENIVIVSFLVETSPQALPLGAACIASNLKADNFINTYYNVHLLDFSPEDKGIDFSDHKSAAKIIAKKIASFNPTFVGFSIFMWNRCILEEAARQVQLLCPSSILLAGGPEVTAAPQSFSKTFHHAITGAGEIKVRHIITNLTKNKNLQNNFLGMKDYGEKSKDITRTKLMSEEMELLSSPYLDGTLDVKKYGGALWELARGCPFKCSYCYESKGEKKIKRFPMERLKAELEYFKKNNVGQVFVLDPTYNADKKRAVEILDFIRINAPEIFFHFEVRSEYLDKELAKKFASINCSLQIGLQSANENVLALVNRNFNKKEFSKKIALLNESGAIFGLDLIYGLPEDSLTSFKNSIDYALSLYPNHLEVFRLSVLPGTDLYDRVVNGELKLNFMDKPPYHILSSPSFSKEDLLIAEKIAKGVSVFYTRGRSVPWFNIILSCLKIKANDFFLDFADFLETKKINLEKLNFQDIKKLQIDFTEKAFFEKFGKKKNYKDFITCVKDIINLNAAFSAAYADGQTTVISLNYHPESLFSSYVMDLQNFVHHEKKYPCKIKVYPSKEGSSYKFLFS